MAEDKRTKFERLGQKRMTQLLNDMDKVKKLSNKVNYEYTQKDVNKIQDALQKKMDEVIHSFEENLKKGGGKTKAENEFTFNGGYNKKQSS